MLSIDIFKIYLCLYASSLFGDCYTSYTARGKYYQIKRNVSISTGEQSGTGTGSGGDGSNDKIRDI